MPFKFPVTIIAIREYLRNSLATLSADTPGLDMILFLWGGLVLLFLRAVVLKDMLNIITIGFGFILQAGFMALILFK